MNLLPIDVIQSEQDVWVEHNFPGMPIAFAHMGMIEEFGELMHAVLKDLQGIRGSQRKNMIDAIGDFWIYGCQYCSRIGMRLEYISTRPISLVALHGIDIPLEMVSWNGLTEEASLKLLRNSCLLGLHIIESNTPEMQDRKAVEYHMIRMWQSFYIFCEVRGINFHHAISSTWEDVRERDWKANPTDGNEKKD